MRVCEQVKAKRMALGMSQLELSSGLPGFSDSTLSRYELGRMSIRLATLKTIAQRLGTTVEEMEKVAASAGHSDPVKDGKLVDPVGERFATALEKSLEFTEESLADKIGVKAPAILRWKADGVPRRRLALVAELLGVSQAWLSEGTPMYAEGAAVAIGGAKAKPEKDPEAVSAGYVIKINDQPEAYNKCHSEVHVATRGEAIVYLWALAKQDIPQYGVVWLPSGVEPMTNLGMFGSEPPAILRARIQAQIDKLNEKDIESIVCQGLNTIYDALGRYGDASDFVNQVTQAAKEWAEECLTEDNYLSPQQMGWLGDDGLP